MSPSETAPDETHLSFRDIREALAELAWPTRCTLCDTPGAVLCDRCRRALPYLDWWRACKRCGAPFGAVQCTECNPITLARRELAELPFAECVSVTHFTPETGRIVRTFKDRGEQRLAEDMTALMVQVIPPSWSIDAICYIPASRKARRDRGFDHGRLLGETLARKARIPLVDALEEPHTKDQRKLGAKQRQANLAGSFRARSTANGKRLMLVDDVFTTGATLCSASLALKQVGALDVHCVTFARVY